MRDINKIIQELYEAYVKKDITLMKTLLDEGKTIDANNSYLKKYEALYDTLNTGGEKKVINGEFKSVLFGGKIIKCPHCGSNLSMSENNKKVIEDYKAGNAKDLNFQCKYCNTQFIWNNVGMKPLYLNISVGQEITLDNKKYRVSGGARYMGSWRTKNSGKLEYIERILIDSSGDTYYLSESKAWWSEGGESGIEYQTELSRKIVPEFNLGELTDSNIVINNNNYNIEEICDVEVTEVYGENSKSYTIGESVKTYQLKYSGKSYVFEKEQTKNQQEIGVYHTWEVDDKNLRSGNIGYQANSGINFSGVKLNFGLAFILTIISFFIPFAIFGSESTIKEVNINDISGKTLSEVKGLYKVNFSDTYKKDVSESTTRYDYGGVKHTIKYLDGIKFKVQTQKDLDILKKIANLELDIKAYQIPKYNLDFTNKSFSSYFTGNTIVNFK